MGDVGISLLPLPAVAFNFMCKMVHSDHTDISIIQVSSKYHYEVNYFPKKCKLYSQNGHWHNLVKDYNKRQV